MPKKIPVAWGSAAVIGVLLVLWILAPRLFQSKKAPLPDRNPVSAPAVAPSDPLQLRIDEIVGRYRKTIVLLEGDDPKALTEFALMWSDLMQLKVAPVIEDADLGEVLARRKK